MSDQEIEELADELLELAWGMTNRMRAARGQPPADDAEMHARHRRDMILALKEEFQ